MKGMSGKHRVRRRFARPALIRYGEISKITMGSGVTSGASPFGASATVSGTGAGDFFGLG